MIKLIKSYDIDVGIIDEVANFKNDKYPNDILTLKLLLSRLMKLFQKKIIVIMTLQFYAIHTRKLKVLLTVCQKIIFL